MSPTTQRASRISQVSQRRVFAALALSLSLFHFAFFDVDSLPVVTDVRYFLYFARRIAEGAVPHLDLFDNKTFLASWVGAALHRSATALGADPLRVIRWGFLSIAALGGWLVYFVHRRLGGGSPVTGLLGLLVYCAFGLIGQLAATGPVPKLLMAVLGSAMALCVHRRRWFAAGLAGGLAFMDWQIGLLVWLAALVSAVVFERDGGRAALRVCVGGAAAILPFVVVYAVRGGLEAAFEQTVLASLFRGTSTLARRDAAARLDRIVQVVAWGSAGRAWLVPAAALGVPVAAVWLWRRRRTATARLLLPLCLLHFGVLGFSALDFQGYGDLALAFHSVAFLLALCVEGLYLGVRRRWIESHGAAAARIFAAAMLVGVAWLARPGPWRPPLTLTLRDRPVEYDLAEQREVAAAVAELASGRRVVFFDHGELLFLARLENALPAIFWNDAVWATFRTSPAESPRETAERLVRQASPGVLAWPLRRLGDGPLLHEYRHRRLESAERRYQVDLWLR